MNDLTTMILRANLLLVKAAAPEASVVGSMFGMLQTAANVGEVSGPAFASSVIICEPQDLVEVLTLPVVLSLRYPLSSTCLEAT